MGVTQSKEIGGFRVCNYGEPSLGKQLGLERYFDYIVGIDGVPLTKISDASHDFFVKRLRGIGRSRLKISVYNSLSSRIRTFVLIPFDEPAVSSPSQSQDEIESTQYSRRELKGNGEKAKGEPNTLDEANFQINFNIALDSTKTFKFSNFDERITGLGIGVHWEEIFKKGIKVVNVQNSSPADKSDIVPNIDFIVGSEYLKRPFYSTDDFLTFIRNNDGSKISLSIYNSETEILREVSITPDSSWGGRGLLGCDIAAGSMADIPFRKNLNVKEHHGSQVYGSSSDPDTKNTKSPTYDFTSRSEHVSICTSFDEKTKKMNFVLKDPAMSRVDNEIDCSKSSFDELSESRHAELNKHDEKEASVQEINNEDGPNGQVEGVSDELTLADAVPDFCVHAQRSEGAVLIKDYSFDQYRIKQSDNIDEQNRQEIIEKAMINDANKHIYEDSDYFGTNNNNADDYFGHSKPQSRAEPLSTKNSTENITLESTSAENETKETPTFRIDTQIEPENGTEIFEEMNTDEAGGENETETERKNTDDDANTSKKDAHPAGDSIACMHLHSDVDNVHADTYDNPTEDNTQTEHKQRELSEIEPEKQNESDHKGGDLDTDTPGQVMTPLSEREYEIFKKLIEIKPVLGYNPPGILESSEETYKD